MDILGFVKGEISQRDSKFQTMFTYTGPTFMSLYQANFPAEVLSEIFTVCLEENSSPWRWQQTFLWEKCTCIHGPWTDSGVWMPFPLSINGLWKFGTTTERKHTGLTSMKWPSLVGLALHCGTLSALHWVCSRQLGLFSSFFFKVSSFHNTNNSGCDTHNSVVCFSFFFYHGDIYIRWNLPFLPF